MTRVATSLGAFSGVYQSSIFFPVSKFVCCKFAVVKIRNAYTLSYFQCSFITCFYLTLSKFFIQARDFCERQSTLIYHSAEIKMSVHQVLLRLVNAVGEARSRVLSAKQKIYYYYYYISSIFVHILHNTHR